MTGYVEVDVRQPWLDRGFHTVRKPFSSAEIGAPIDQMMGSATVRSSTVPLRT